MNERKRLLTELGPQPVWLTDGGRIVRVQRDRARFDARPREEPVRVPKDYLELVLAELPDDGLENDPWADEDARAWAEESAKAFWGDEWDDVRGEDDEEADAPEEDEDGG